jgi:serine/threonine protein kinase
MGNKQKENSALNEGNLNNKTKVVKDTNIVKVLINRNAFDFVTPIGRGGFGKVWKVHHKKYKNAYALKEMSKAKVIDKRSERSIKAERDLLSQLRHPFIVNMHYAFQDTNTLYLVMDLLTGGDMRYHLSKMNHKKMTFTEDQASKSIS